MEKLSRKGVILKSQKCPGEFIPTIFLRKRRTGGYGVNLNLKNLSKFISNHHFKNRTEEYSVIHNLKNLNPCISKQSFQIRKLDFSGLSYDTWVLHDIWRFTRFLLLCPMPVDNNCGKYLKFSWKGDCFSLPAFPTVWNLLYDFFAKLLNLSH